ncbi:hypothetical protein BDV41DRAFT_534023 [Aspergillus transmontanensis]|uniref:Uncharacterized protein n=1 Tax=Aspergillus transmontanensis TaxID=1034304 RepID=A0A5N6W0L1_9EURO|nr:hypothetical protein BDV41DRAFT_534023 [Aspergillus transmontanensis]
MSPKTQSPCKPHHLHMPLKNEVYQVHHLALKPPTNPQTPRPGPIYSPIQTARMYALIPPETPAIFYTIFGIQHHAHGTPSPLSTQLTTLLTPHLPPQNTTALTHPGPGPLTTAIHLTYWPTQTLYEEW